MNDLHGLISRMADELDYYRQLLTDDRRELHALAVEARAALAAEADGPAVPEGREPASVVGEPSDELVAQWIADVWHEGTPVRVAASDLHLASKAAEWGARYGHQPAPPAAGEQRHPAPEPVASETYFEFVISDADGCTEAGGIAPTYIQALSEGQHYLAQYQQDGPHTLELRRVEVLPPGAFPVPDDAPVPVLPNDTQVIEPTEHTLLVPVPVPVAVSERLPGPEDCDDEGRCWLLTVEDEYPQWRLHSIEGSQPGGSTMVWVPVDSSPGVMVDCFYTSHWLPAHALPLPQGEVE